MNFDFAMNVTQGARENDEQMRNKRLENLKVLEEFKRLNPEATTQDLVGLTEQLSGGSNWLRGGMPSQDILSHLGQIGQERKQRRIGDEKYVDFTRAMNKQVGRQQLMEMTVKQAPDLATAQESFVTAAQQSGLYDDPQQMQDDVIHRLPQAFKDFEVSERKRQFSDALEASKQIIALSPNQPISPESMDAHLTQLGLDRLDPAAKKMLTNSINAHNTSLSEGAFDKAKANPLILQSLAMGNIEEATAMAERDLPGFVDKNRFRTDFNSWARNAGEVLSSSRTQGLVEAVPQQVRSQMAKIEEESAKLRPDEAQRAAENLLAANKLGKGNADAMKKTIISLAGDTGRSVTDIEAALNSTGGEELIKAVSQGVSYDKVRAAFTAAFGGSSQQDRVEREIKARQADLYLSTPASARNYIKNLADRRQLEIDTMKAQLKDKVTFGRGQVGDSIAVFAPGVNVEEKKKLVGSLVMNLQNVTDEIKQIAARTASMPNDESRRSVDDVMQKLLAQHARLKSMVTSLDNQIIWSGPKGIGDGSLTPGGEETAPRWNPMTISEWRKKFGMPEYQGPKSERAGERY